MLNVSYLLKLCSKILVGSGLLLIMTNCGGDGGGGGGGKECPKELQPDIDAWNKLPNMDKSQRAFKSNKCFEIVEKYEKFNGCTSRVDRSVKFSHPEWKKLCERLKPNE